MWKSSIRGIVSNQVRFSFSNDPDGDIDRVYQEVLVLLEKIAWFHRAPVLILATVTTIICIARYSKNLDALDQDKQDQFINNAAKLPFWGLFQKLICSITLLHYFDAYANIRNAQIGSLRS